MYYQIRVLAKDGGEPSMTDTAVVYVHVNRNNYQPRFETVQYKETLLETQALGLAFVRVSARDQDNKRPYNELRYTLKGDVGIIQYFMIDEKSGDISLKKSFMDDPDKRDVYDVSIGHY